jgi:HTH-type transcriptional regulator/antitoxin HipB
MKTIPFDKIKDKYIGSIGSPERDQYEFELQLELIGETIREIRKKRNLTQEQLGELIGVRKAQISKLENNRKNITLDTMIKVFHALKAKIDFNVELIK